MLQALDAGGKDGTIRHVMGAMNPQGTTVTGFKGPTAVELNHDFLWRVHPHAPAKGTVPASIARTTRTCWWCASTSWFRKIWSERYDFINDFEKLLHRENNTHIVKFFLHISKDEQLARFKQRLVDPARNWKISDADYKEREYWDDYTRRLRKSSRSPARRCTLVHSLPIRSGSATSLSRRSS